MKSVTEENECKRNGWEHVWCNCGGGWHCTTCGIDAPMPIYIVEGKKAVGK